jgi:spore germination protein YaaH
MTKRFLCLLFFFTVFSITAAPKPEIWAYLFNDEEKYFPTKSSITDIACFSAQVDGDGNLKGGSKKPLNLNTSDTNNIRYHLVISAPWNSTLLHIFLNKELPIRNKIITNIVEQAKQFDGVQIDFESINSADGTAFFNFLIDLKKALPPEKILSVAVRARWKEYMQKHPNDAFNYPMIGKIADRIIIMAYDEHYSSSKPGPIASTPWCKKIYSHALETLPPEKIIMGIPFYGRSWQSPTSFAHAYKNNAILDEIKQRNIVSIHSSKNGANYTFNESVQVTVFYETIQSLEAKIRLYSSTPIRGIAFWRLGQEPDQFWEKLIYP